MLYFKSRSTWIPIKTQYRLLGTISAVDRLSLFKKGVELSVDTQRIITNPVQLLAYGTDASFYRLAPKMVIDVASESEVVQILKQSNEFKVPVTFRAAGTSLSGQAITDSVLVRIIPTKWRKYEIIGKQAEAVRVQPGMIGGDLNRKLLPYWKKIGPDPASLDSCMLGGIVANNSSGMCCTLEQNSYRSIKDMRIIFADGTILDTSSEASRREFEKTHESFLNAICELRDKIREDKRLTERIIKKFSIKNTMGYGLNSLVDYDDPIEIVKHLMVGSEGTWVY